VPRAVLFGCVLGLASCQAAPIPAPPGAAVDPAHLHVLALNGGGKPPQNYRSHLLHVEQLLALLDEAGVPRANVSLLSADGPDPAADLAVREVQPERDFWLLGGTRLEAPLRTPVTYESSAIPGAKLEAATKARVQEWFAGEGHHLRTGDTLLVFVTDHGTKNDADPTDNRIVLWGDDTLSAHELRDLVATLDPGVRVVLLMSQCFSGSFAGLREARPGVCGYFASTADRPAYGCYPENRGRDNVGHAFQFLKALAATPTFPAAQMDTLVTDATPDVPIATSDVALRQLLEGAASAAGSEPEALIDQLLREAWRDKPAWEPEIRLLDRIGHAFGLFSPRSLAELDEQTRRLPEASDTLKTYAAAWKVAFGDLAQVNLDRFLAGEPAWQPRLTPAALQSLQPPATRALTEELLAALAPFSQRAGGAEPRLRVLRERGDDAAAANYRMEVRLGVVLRLRALLTTIAGRQYLATRASAEERSATETLRTCEAFRLADRPLTLAHDATPADTAPFPPYDEDLRVAARVLPAWMGIRFKALTPKQRTALSADEGPSVVVAVYPDSPAHAAGFAVGDVVLGPPGAHFTEPNQIRQWTMLSKIDKPAPLDVVRGEQHLRLTLVPKPYPLQWPALPGPPKVGSVAPPLGVVAYRGRVPVRLDDGKPHLLFFWATWCLPCKASLPEVLAFERAQKTQVVAITDETSDQLEPFFKQFEGDFPQAVAVDEERRAFLAFGVSGTPTFVLVDGSGHVRSYVTGYSPDQGLALEGWKRKDPPRRGVRRGASP
jgi:thiol-disulfide isomerase/thioredoxin